MHDWYLANQLGSSVLWKCKRCRASHSSSRKPEPSLMTSAEKDGRYVMVSCTNNVWN